MSFDPVSFALGAASGGGGSSTLSGLTDVDISNPTDGQTLVYNATSGKWKNGAGGGGLIVNVTEHNRGEANEYADMDKTAGEIVAALNSGRNVVFRMVVPDAEGEYFAVGLLVGYGRFTSEGMTVDDYTFNMKSGGGDFHGGEYGCYGADGYPSTQPAEVGGNA